VLSIGLSTTGCATNKARIDAAAADKARAGQVEVALAAAEKQVQQARRMPDYPAGCRALHFSGVEIADRYDVATKKTDIALGDANKQIGKCAAWYDRTQKGREPK
jgi:hypothetical protein